MAVATGFAMTLSDVVGRRTTDAMMAMVERQIVPVRHNRRPIGILIPLARDPARAQELFQMAAQAMGLDVVVTVAAVAAAEVAVLVPVDADAED